MKYYVQQLPNGRWGIYQDFQLLATIGCYCTYQKILSCLKDSNKKKLRSIDLLRRSLQTSDILSRLTREELRGVLRIKAF